MKKDNVMASATNYSVNAAQKCRPAPKCKTITNIYRLSAQNCREQNCISRLQIDIISALIALQKISWGWFGILVHGMGP